MQPSNATMQARFLSPPNPAKLRDRFGRQIHYLRLSVTDRCNLRCIYCMAENMQFLPSSHTLDWREMLHIGRAFVSLGVDKIRLTGGEPLIHPHIVPLCRELARLPGLRQLALSTNGLRLPQYATALRKAGVERLNISLDSLDPGRFQKLSRHGDLQQALSGIKAARAAGFRQIRLNSVILRGINEEDILPLVEFARAGEFDLCFIEEMPLGTIDSHQRSQSQKSSPAIREHISARYPLSPTTENTGGPARYYKMPGAQSRIAFISPNSENFCADCNRVRVSAEGRLLLCLGHEDSTDLRDILRKHPGDLRHLQHSIRMAIQHKPERHHFNPHAIQPQILRFMNTTGG